MTPIILSLIGTMAMFVSGRRYETTPVKERRVRAIGLAIAGAAIIGMAQAGAYHLGVMK
ncbi:hypothetical protein [Acetobacter okinawensis]|uniref:hypothetical protein n=1 Tax=Acetobacter okinawensis TaxID=1076594 RepID=UPI0020A1AFFE|nr:hypothetical protein [Acetobacter okinawensis]MCP1214425.1 hypothetical protein [Acetobacter okinawensis]